MECKVAVNRQDCACPSGDCERKGICCECLRFHLAKESLPMCMRKLTWLKVVKG